jgi:type I restriction enzyme S subunit
MDLMPYITGSTRLKLNKSSAERIKIPLPPIAEQQRIAAILDKAEEIRRKRLQAIEKLDQLAQSTFVEMFGEAKWRKVAIAEVTEQVQNCSPQSKFVGEFTYVDIGAVDNVSKKVINPQLLNKDDAPSRARQLIEKDDVLVSTVRPNLNAVAQVESEYFNAVASTGFCVLRCKQELVLPEYIFAIVKSTKFVNEMVRLATGASYPAVNDKIISQYLISLPPIELQRAFSEKIKALREYASKSVKHDDKLIGLTASLQHQAFTTGFRA